MSNLLISAENLLENIKIANKKTLSPELGWSDVMICRPHLLSNPYRIAVDGDRPEVIQKFRVYLWDQIKRQTVVYKELLNLISRLKSGQKLRLICWCAPEPCHGDVIISALRYLINTLGY